MKLGEKKEGALLKVLSTISNFAIAYSRHPAHTSRSAYDALRDFENLQKLSNVQLSAVSRYLIRKKYICIRKRGGISTIELTDSGSRALRRGTIKDLKPKPQKVWDGLWHLVIFDVPSSHKAARDAFAAILKHFGFVPYQKSVFITPYPCEEEIEAVADYFNVSNCVEIILAAKITHAELYLRKFKLHNP